MSGAFCANHQIEWNASHDEECPCCRMERDLAAAIGQRDHLMNCNGELQMEVDVAKAKLADIESMQCSQCAIRESMCDDISAANHARAEAEDAVKRLEQVSGELCPKCGWAMKFPGESCRCELVSAIARVKAWKQHTSVSMISGKMAHHDCQCIECKTMRRVIAELDKEAV